MMNEAMEAHELLRSSVSVVLFTMMAFLIGLLFHGYWLNWAHRRIERMKKDIEDLKKENESLRRSINELKTPFPWLKARN